MDRFCYFPGCSLHATAREYDESLRAVAQRLDLQLDEIKEWVCCGATPAHAVAPEIAEGLALWNLTRAAETGPAPVLTGCASCFSRLRHAHRELLEHPERAQSAVPQAGRAPDPRQRVLHILQVLAQPDMLARLKAAVQRPLNGLPVACYYGCLLTRPPGEDAVDDAEDPHVFEDLVRALGAQPVDFPLRLDCCGSSMALPRPELVHELCGRLLAQAHERGAKVLLVVCPLCHSNLDFQQEAAAAACGLEFRMPVLYATQLVGLALGVPEVELGLRRHFVPVPVEELVAAPAAATS